MHVLHFLLKLDGLTNRPTDRRTNGRTKPPIEMLFWTDNDATVRSRGEDRNVTTVAS